MKPLFLCLLMAVASFSASAADMSCAQQLGQQRATLMAQQCRQVSPATHPPCNAANSCAMVIDELERGCKMMTDQSPVTKFCRPVDRAGAFRGYLLKGGGTDAVSVTVMTDKGDRIFAYCAQHCGNLFSAPDKHEAVSLRKQLIGKLVAIDVTIERNHGRIPGPDDDEKIPLVKRITLMK